MPASTLRVGRTGTGYRIRIEGRGTMRESPAVHEFAVQVLEHEPCMLVIDLTSCDYLDSTFLGCLAVLHRRYGLEQPPRFAVAAPPHVCTRLLSSTRLDLFLDVVAAPPEVFGEEVILPPLASAPDDLGHHVMECHRRLAELGGRDHAAFERIADQLEKELMPR